jgi:5-methylcytosine-specific restriction endonuclease McrA
MSHVFVLDTTRNPLNPVHPGEARRLLSLGKAAVFKRFPFTIILKIEIAHPQVEELRLKLDPGSRTTGIAIVNDVSGQVVFSAELSHRGQAIKASLDDRRALRRSRRQRKTRYRKSRWSNRRRKAGWLPPSLLSCIANVLTWINRLSRLCSISAISMELVRFDTQLMENPEISGIEYQQGTLMGYELREYLLEKWGRQCAYCEASDRPLQVEHIHPRANGGTNRVSNLTLACESCNRAKGTQDIKDFLKKKPPVLARIQAQARQPLKDAAAVNSSRWALFERLKETGLAIECGSGGLTKFNRTTHNIAKTHWSDAACVGKSTPAALKVDDVKPLLIKATGHGRRQMCLPDKYGFPRTAAKGTKKVHGFQTGDIVKAIVPTGKKQGTYWGRVAVRSTGSFNIVTQTRTVQGISYRHCRTLHQSDGYTYTKGGALPPHA